jgi:adenylyltransferase/sulfurtransferase
MSIKIVIPSYLRPFTNHVAVVEVNGSTVGGCLDNLTKQSPDIKKVLYAKNGELLDYVSIYVQGKDAYPEELAKPVKDGDEIHIIYIIAGG